MVKFEWIDQKRLEEALGYILYTEDQANQGKWLETSDIVTTRREIGYTMIVNVLKGAKDNK